MATTNHQPVYVDTMSSRRGYFHMTMVLLLFAAAPGQVECASFAVHRQLLKDLEGNYTYPYMRPVNDKTKPVLVGLRFAPLIATLDGTNQELTVRGMLALKWRDFRLQWEPEDYDDIKETTIPLSFNGNNKFWIPELSLLESLETDFQSIYPETHSATLTYPGDIHWYTLATTKSYCNVDNACFPFDYQTCNLTFTTWLYQTNEQLFQIIPGIVENGTYKKYGLPNALWSVELKHPVEVDTMSYQCETCNGENQSLICYHLELRRIHSGTFIWILASPCIVVSILLMYIPWMNKRNGTDIPAYGLTCVLGLIVYLLYLHNELPQTGPAWFIGIYITVTIIAGVVVVGLVVAGLFDFNHDRLDTDEQAVSSPPPNNTQETSQDGQENKRPAESQNTSNEQQGEDTGKEEDRLIRGKKQHKKYTYEDEIHQNETTCNETQDMTSKEKFKRGCCITYIVILSLFIFIFLICCIIMAIK